MMFELQSQTKKLPALILLMLGMCTWTIADDTVPSAINEQSQKATKAQLDYLQRKIRAINSNIQVTEKKFSTVTKALKSNEKQINTISKKLRITKKALRQSRDKLMAMKADKKLLDGKKAKHIELLTKQIKSAFVNGDQEYLKLLLNQKRPEVIGRNMIFYHYLSNARIDSVKELKETLVALEKVEKDITIEITRLGELKGKQEKRERDLIAQKKQRRKLVKQLKKEIASQGAQLNTLKDNEKELMAILAAINEAIKESTGSIAQTDLTSLKGKLKWPLDGKVINKFGKERDEGKLKWKGVLITAPEGKDVRAIHHGRVMYADWLRGFGLLAVVDHGNGYVSLYGHNQSLYKEAGDWIESGELISTVGQSGGNDRTGLYFEIRKGAKPLNPTQWCTRS